MKKLPSIPDIAEQEQTPAVKVLLVLVEQLMVRVQQHDEIIRPATSVPEGSRFKGYRDFIVQDLNITVHTTRYRLEHWVTSDNKTLKGQLPPSLAGRHFGPHLVGYILYQYHHCQTTQPLLLEQLREWGIDISKGQINHLLVSGQAAFHAEKEALLNAGLSASSFVTVDDSGARHQGNNGYVTHIGNDLFAWFKSTESKSRLNFLLLLRAGNTDYQVSHSALNYMHQQGLPQQMLARLTLCRERGIANQHDWSSLLDELLIIKPRHQRIATEGALLGSILHHGLCDDIAIISDGAGQFNILAHALCWIHTERLIHKLVPLNEVHRQDIARVRDQVWCFYRALKAYKIQPVNTSINTLSGVSMTSSPSRPATKH